MTRMKTVGEILSSVRKQKQLTIEVVAKKTKIRPHYLQAIESNSFDQLPSVVVAQGFIKNYAEFVGTSASYAQAIFRRDFSEDQSGKIIPRQLAEPLDRIPFWQSPRFGYFLVGFGLLIIVGAYLFFQYFSFWNGPGLELTSPEDGLITEERYVEVAGCTQLDAVVKINEQLVSLDHEGCFRQGVNLIEGENQILVKAENKIGRAQEKILRVVREG